MCKPVSKKGADEIFGISRHLNVIWEDEGVLVVHDLPISSDEGLGVERSFSCKKGEEIKAFNTGPEQKKHNSYA